MIKKARELYGKNVINKERIYEIQILKFSLTIIYCLLIGQNS